MRTAASAIDQKPAIDGAGGRISADPEANSSAPSWFVPASMPMQTPYVAPSIGAAGPRLLRASPGRRSRPLHPGDCTSHHPTLESLANSCFDRDCLQTSRCQLAIRRALQLVSCLSFELLVGRGRACRVDLLEDLLRGLRK